MPQSIIGIKQGDRTQNQFHLITPNNFSAMKIRVSSSQKPHPPFTMTSFLFFIIPPNPIGYQNIFQALLVQVLIH